MPTRTWTDVLEEVIDGAASRIIDTVQAAVERYGPRPYQFATGSRLDKLEYYVRHRDDKPFWLEQAAEWTRLYGMETADAMLMGTTTTYETQIEAMGGPVTVFAAIDAARARRVGPAVKRAERELNLAPVEILPPLPVHDPLVHFQSLGDSA